MSHAHIAHNCLVGDHTIVCSGALVAGHVVLEDQAFVSGNCVVHQHVRVGRLAILRGLSRTSRDVPPFAIMDGTHTVRGVNRIGLRRAGLDATRIRALRDRLPYAVPYPAEPARGHGAGGGLAAVAGRRRGPGIHPGVEARRRDGAAGGRLVGRRRRRLIGRASPKSAFSPQIGFVFGHPAGTTRGTMTVSRWSRRSVFRTAALLVATLSTTPALSATSLISVDLGGAAAGGAGLNRNPGSPADISPDGRFVLFTSTAADLVSGVSDTNSAADLFVRDRVAGTTAIVSVSAGKQALGASALGGLAFSPDSKRLVFRTQANNVVAGLTDSNNSPDWFVRELLTGVTSCVTVNAAGTATGNLTSFTQEPPVFSPDGTRLAFVSIAGNLVDGVTDQGGRDIFVRNLESGVTSLVSVRTDGAASGLSVDDPPQFSPDGRFLAFLDMSPSLVAGVTDNNNFTDLFVRDLQTSSTRLVTRGAANQAVMFSSEYVWTPDGSTIVFSTSGTNVVAGIADTNNGVDVFAWDAGNGRGPHAEREPGRHRGWQRTVPLLRGQPGQPLRGVRERQHRSDGSLRWRRRQGRPVRA